MSVLVWGAYQREDGGPTLYTFDLEVVDDSSKGSNGFWMDMVRKWMFWLVAIPAKLGYMSCFRNRI